MMRIKNNACQFLVVFLLSLAASFAQPTKITIKTTSSTEYKSAPQTSIYPAFVDGTAYQSWSEKGAKPYFQLQAEGGKPPYTWEKTSGNLPGGMVLTPEGLLKGTPVKEGNFNFTVRTKDAGGAVATKNLIFQAKPFRSKWLADAKFGIMIQWGPFVEPVLWTKEEIPAFEKRITKFNADQWAAAVKNMGGKVLNFTVKSGDGIRLWPSVTPSRYELKTQRNIVKELITACHKQGIKFVAYFAPDHNWNKKISDSGTDQTWGTLNKGLIRELVKMGVDGFWVDMGGTPELYKNVDPNWFPWDEIIPIMRTNNPDVIFANNPGLGNGGTVLRWPHTDVLVYEGRMDQGEDALITAKPASINKKVAIEVDNLLDKEWGWFPSRGIPSKNAKSADMIIQNIKANWEVGATYMLNYPVPTDGDILPAAYKPTLDKIAAFVKGDANVLPAPTSSLSADSTYAKPQTLRLTSAKNAAIYYTTDGSEPTQKSKRYTKPLSISNTTIVKAIAVTPGKGSSRKMNHAYYFKTNATTGARLVSAASSESNVGLLKEEKDYFRGMRVTVQQQSIVLNAVGRKNVEGNQKSHRILIKRYSDDFPIFSGSLDTKKAKVDKDGFQYVNLPRVILEKGKSYIIAFQENNSDQYLSNKVMPQIGKSGVAIAEHFILSPTGDRAPVTDDGVGALLNLDYSPLAEKSANLALGAFAALKGKTGKDLKPVRNIMYPENAVDGDLATRAQAGGEYAWTLELDLHRSVPKLTQAKVTFGKDAFATDFTLMVSQDGKEWQPAAEKAGNKQLTVALTFKPVSARYVRLQSLKPDGPNQPGNQMSIVELELYP